ncbi:DNA-processing protein DprA [Veronia pacifica]|uniref:DNA protecting protein DprA n=1 Tax=Veronia pacifica TaxID=1080227 RepID=A0A1C3EFF1_9GAMM|nr:DNA-processing protein DprA [Veronia pacifica]ODA31987.1 DNA protecting protein DprA [Veronia pacifica]
MNELESWIRLSAVPRLGGRKIGLLLSRASPSQLIAMSADSLRGLGLTDVQIASLHQDESVAWQKCRRWLDNPHHHILTLTDNRYPYLLRQIPSPPPLLFIKGNPDVLSLPQIAVVGSRNASHEGLALARKFGAELASNNLVVTSGLALGIDGRAHRGVLDVDGTTIAVLGSGLENVYPAHHIELAGEIIERGALVSELWPWSPPRAAFFPKRNRIISGLSSGVLVVEAAFKSGSLITARCALEQGRDVFALPGSIHNPHAQGSNGLIKQGAYLVESIDDVLSQTGILSNCAINHLIEVAPGIEQQEELPFPHLLANVGNEATCVDVLAEICDQPVHEIMMQLLELELQGFVSAVPGGYVRTRRG